ncbi:hypothetical protein EVAR_7855_1 [Eumeta japonica]|uniref:Uncharacterized protein n=1 Tax=Eumeta variegata TaxID=151549 RepID=A0A4C1TV09_EUMVA|nr:hypothetical protein EVAR_7855_1 [Eumeta japonica]
MTHRRPLEITSACPLKIPIYDPDLNLYPDSHYDFENFPSPSPSESKYGQPSIYIHHPDGAGKTRPRGGARGRPLTFRAADAAPRARQFLDAAPQLVVGIY